MAAAWDDQMSTMMGLPYFSPMMGINLSGLCATTRVLQTRSLGLYMCDISRKFQKDPSYATDLGREDFMERKKNIAKIEKHNEKLGRYEKWMPILYTYELYRGAATVSEDYGHLVFTEPTLTKYLLVNMYGPEACDCGNPYHNDYAAMITLQAQRFLNLLVYLQGEEGPRPKWVRATFTTNKHKNWHPEFLTSTEVPLRSSSYAPIIHLAADDLVPSLRLKDITLINSTIAKMEPRVTPEQAVAKYVREEDKDKVLDDKAAKTKHVTPNMTIHKVERECAGCNQLKPAKTLKLCSGCRLVAYCTKECQVDHWKMHKMVCRKAVANKGQHVDKPSTSDKKQTTAAPADTQSTGNDLLRERLINQMVEMSLRQTASASDEEEDAASLDHAD